MSFDKRIICKDTLPTSLKKLGKMDTCLLISIILIYHVLLDECVFVLYLVVCTAEAGYEHVTGYVLVNDSTDLISVLVEQTF